MLVGHVEKMEENRIPKRVLYMNLGTTRLRGGPRNRWQDEVREDGRIAGGEEWQEKVHNREEWKKLLRTARNCRILHMPMEWMNDMRASRTPDTFNKHSRLKNQKPDSMLHHLTNFLCSPSNTHWIFNAQALLCITRFIRHLINILWKLINNNAMEWATVMPVQAVNVWTHSLQCNVSEKRISLSHDMTTYEWVSHKHNNIQVNLLQKRKKKQQL